MFSLRLSISIPIPIDNTLTPPPKTNNNNPSPSSYSTSQTHRFHWQPHTITKVGTTTPSVALRNDGTFLSGDSQPEKVPPELEPELMPKHVAVIMDGNGRWAKLRGLPPSAGHQAGARALRALVRLCCSWEIKVLTVFGFSTDNWLRPKVEVDFLMSLFERTINSEIEAFKRCQTPLLLLNVLMKHVG